MMTVILAVARDGAIGDKGDLLWHLRGDLQRFKKLTMGHAIVMGRRTWESLPKGALPGRRNIVVSRNPNFKAEGAEVVASLDEALRLCEGQDIYIIGGAQIYAAALPLAERLELTRVDAEYPEADTRVDAEALCRGMRLEAVGDWEMDEKSGLKYRFETYSK